MEFIDKSQIMRGIGPDSTAEVLQKGRPAMIGEIREWQGKKYKKQVNGKWLEVSEQGMTKEEHDHKYNQAMMTWQNLDSEKHKQIANEHAKSSNILSDKEVDLDVKEIGHKEKDK